MKVLHVCAEFFPLLKTGGLADVVAALLPAQRQLGADARVLLPGFPAIINQFPDKQKVTKLNTFVGEVTLFYCLYHDTPLYIIDAPHLYQREGSPYHDNYHNAYQDNYLRFGLLGFVAAELARGCDPLWNAQIVHAHDWHAALACAYLAAYGYPARCMFTLHNIAYQGLFSPHHIHELWLPPEFYNTEGMEFFGQLSFMKAGLFYANHTNAVSPTYAREILNPYFSYGLDGLLNRLNIEHRLSGILNGIDTDVWSPASDKLIAQNYNERSLKKKSKNKLALQESLGLTKQIDKPLFAVVSRMTHQKGLDLILDVLPDLLSTGGQFVLLGNGDYDLENAYRHAQSQYPDQVRAYIGYDEALSHQVIAGADVLMVPSRFEPCGLTQLYALRYGTLPLVRKTGGLADTVTDCSLEAMRGGQATGFVFNESHPFDLKAAVDRALALWDSPEQWQQVQKNAMAKDVSWKKSAETYLDVYRQLLGQ
ncbi:glycogen synthase GlgA [Providencia sneebia]|uniref:Glycogen synthase n=1 Tax=Providencia sneebia DSM 19967 TaxID=1141660 RepID=K8WU19_9GAMM|nr:glycogen synthase GlgA [Providencia sneebia]EKT60917.1 glycogen synthase [Providencia sneebia DSM 19967]